MSQTIAYNKDIVSSKSLSAVLGVVFFIIATSLGAYVRIPVPASPVPITLQTFFVLLSGAVLGRRLGGISQIGYILLGVTGLPVFQGAGFGISYLLGPTGGYLAGFVAASYAVGYLTRQDECSIARLIAAFCAGSVMIYAFGASWLICIYGAGFAQAISIGVLPFIAGDVTKILLAALIYFKISRRVHTLFPV